MMANERKVVGRPIILTVVTFVCLFCSLSEFLCNKDTRRHGKLIVS